MKLISEFNDIHVSNMITEAKDSKVKTYAIEGIFAQSNQKNRNGRIYEDRILRPVIEAYNQNQVTKGRAVGELNHPAGPTINLDKVSHRITELNWDGDNVVGKAQILDTPMGKIVKNLMDGGVQLGVSTRGMGTLESRNGSMYVKDDFHLATIDIVQDPSAPDAFVNGIMEGVEFFFDESSGIFKQTVPLRERMRKMSTREISEQQTKLFKDFLNELKRR